MTASLISPPQPCVECPWRTDVETHRFEVELFEVLAASAHDMARMVFQCHKTRDDRPLVCAGFLLRGACHNLTVRLSLARGELGSVHDGDHPLFDSYRAMAVANGVDPNASVLEGCRDDR